MEREIPKHLQHLKVYRGFPVPYFVPERDGQFIFKYADANKIMAAWKYKKCGICFKPIEAPFYFISGPMGLMNGVDSHAPMHKECCEYSLKICPHLFFEKAERTTPEEEINSSFQIRDKPKELFIVKSDEVEQLWFNGPLFKFRVVSTEKYVYQEGKLKQETIKP